ncbi:Nop8 protein [Martiniozyma asiatica (nom. inval.)]|nr:Nop8 protein [Martiniozyma asiatica]
MSKETQSEYRLYVGNISPALAKSITDLETRFAKYGTIITPFDIRQKGILDSYFGYITMTMSSAKYKELKNLFKAVKFKGSNLIIDEAKPDWKEKWLIDSKRQDDKITQRRLRSTINNCRLERIANSKENPFKLALVQKGRLRTSPRKDLKSLTVRVNYRGRLRLIKCKKSKLWGIAKNRKIRDLTYRFIAGEWRDGNEHVIDRLSEKVIIFDDDGIKVQDQVANTVGDNAVVEELMEEKDKTNKILAGLLSAYNFEKPVKLDNDHDEKAGSDYELDDHDYDNESDNEIQIEYNVPEKNCVKPTQESIVEEYKQHHELLNIQSTQQQLDDNDNDDDDDDDDEFYKNLTAKFNAQPASPDEKDGNEIEIEIENPNESESESESENNNAHLENPSIEIEAVDHDEEFIPLFGEQNNQATNDNEESEDEFIPNFGASSNEQPESNTTEALRALLNPLDQPNPAKTPVIDEVPTIIEPPTINRNKNLGLFFAHFESPFLVAQAQINKFRNINVQEELNWDDWFWKNRGELNREFRRRRRDVLKHNRKKSKSFGAI